MKQALAGLRLQRLAERVLGESAGRTGFALRLRERIGLLRLAERVGHAGLAERVGERVDLRHVGRGVSRLADADVGGIGRLDRGRHAEGARRPDGHWRGRRRPPPAGGVLVASTRMRS